MTAFGFVLMVIGVMGFWIKPPAATLQVWDWRDLVSTIPISLGFVLFIGGVAIFLSERMP